MGLNTAEHNTTDAQQLHRIEAIVRKWKRRRRWLLLTSSAVFVSAILVPPITASLHVPLSARVMTACAIIGIGGSFLTLFLGLFVRPWSRSELHRLWRIDDVSTIGTILETTEMWLPEMTWLAEERLTVLLPLMDEAAAHSLSGHHRNGLRNLLGTSGMRTTASGDVPPREKSFVLAALEYLGRFGHGEDIAVVKQLLATWALRKTDADVQTAAQACLTQLEAHALLERDPGRLLRPSEPVHDGTDLLRPARITLETPPEHMLRSSDNCGD